MLAESDREHDHEHERLLEHHHEAADVQVRRAPTGPRCAARPRRCRRSRSARTRAPRRAPRSAAWRSLSMRASRALEAVARRHRLDQEPPEHDARREERSRARARAPTGCSSASSYSAGKCQSHIAATSSDQRDDRMRQRPERLLDRAQAAHRRAHEARRQPEQQQDRREVGEQQVLDHVRREQALLAEPCRSASRARRTARASPPRRTATRAPVARRRGRRGAAQVAASATSRRRRRPAPGGDHAGAGATSDSQRPRGSFARRIVAVVHWSRMRICLDRGTHARAAPRQADLARGPAAVRRLPRARALRAWSVRRLPGVAGRRFRARAAAAAGRRAVVSSPRCPECRGRALAFRRPGRRSPTRATARDLVAALKLRGATPRRRIHGAPRSPPGRRRRLLRGTLVPVPAHPAPAPPAGFNQAAWLAPSARARGEAAASRTCSCATRRSTPQVGLERRARLVNAACFGATADARRPADAWCSSTTSTRPARRSTPAPARCTAGRGGGGRVTFARALR